MKILSARYCITSLFPFNRLCLLKIAAWPFVILQLTSTLTHWISELRLSAIHFLISVLVPILVLRVIWEIRWKGNSLSVVEESISYPDRSHDKSGSTLLIFHHLLIWTSGKRIKETTKNTGKMRGKRIKKAEEMKTTSLAVQISRCRGSEISNVTRDGYFSPESVGKTCLYLLYGLLVEIDAVVYLYKSIYRVRNRSWLQANVLHPLPYKPVVSSIWK